MSANKVTGGSRYSRTLGIYSIEYLLRTLRNLGPLFDFDYERMIITLSVSMGNVQHLMNPPEQLAPFEDITAIIPAEIQRPVTRLAITRATGLPRETVRRKVAALVESGFLIKDERGGVRLRPGALTDPKYVGAVLQNDADVRRMIRLAKPWAED